MADDRSTTRRGLLRSAGLAGAAGLAGCTDAIPGLDGRRASPGAGDPVRGWAWDVGADALSSTVDPYLAQAGEGSDVVVERVKHSAMRSEFRPALSSGSGAPDFAVLESVVAPSFIETGGLADLSGRIDQELRERFVTGKWMAISRDEEVYALPWDVGPVGVFYRRDVYEQHGIDPSTIETWDQFVEEGEKLPDGVDMINLPPNDLDGVWRRQFRQLGGQPFTADGEVNVHSDASVQVARTIQRMVDAGIANDLQSWGSDWFTAFREGDVASLPAGAWLERALRDSLNDTSGKWGVYKHPAHSKGGNRATNWGGSNLCLPEQTGDERAARAWDYVAWTMTSTEMHNAMYENHGIFPAYEPAYEADIYDEELEFFGGQAIRREFADLAPDIPGYRYTVDTPVVSDAMNTYLGRMVEDELSPTSAVRQAAEQVAEETGRELA